MAGCQDYDEDIRKVNDRLDENTKELTTITEELDAAIAALEDLAATHATKDELKAAKDDVLKALADAQTSIKAAYEAADAALKGQITTDLEGKIAAAKTALEKTISALDSRVGTLETYVSGELKTALENLKKADTANANEIAKVAGELAKAKTYITAEIARVEGLVNAAVKRIEANEGKIQTILSDLDQAKKDILANAGGVDANKKAIEALKNAYEAKVAELEGKIAANVTAIAAEKTAREAADTKLREDFAAADAALKAELEKAIKANTDKIGENETAIKNLQSKMTELEVEIDSLSQLVNDNFETLVSYINDLDSRLDVVESDVTDLMTRLAEVEVDVEALLARVQKIVYLPDFNDGKATIKAAQIGEVIIPAPSTLQYKVYPAELAEDLAEAVENLSFDVEQVATRTGLAELEIVSAEASEGVLSVVVTPRGFVNEFFKPQTRTSYSAALRLTNGNDDYSTEYTNLVADTEYTQISVAVYNGELTADNQFVILDADGETMLADGAEIEYTDRKTTCEILPARQLGFQIAGDPAIYSEEEMKANGYDFEVLTEVVYGAKTYDGAAETEDAIKAIKAAFNTVTDEATGTVTVSLSDKALAETVGYALETMYSYEVCGLQAKAGAVVAIVPVEYSFDITLPTVNWTYTEDAYSDATGKDYRRAFVLAAEDVVSTSAPEDYDYLRVIKDNGYVNAEVTVDGKPAQVTLAVFRTSTTPDGEVVPMVEFGGFEWNKTYVLTGKCQLPSATVTFNTTITTVDRTRSDIRVDLKPIEFQYEKDLVVDYNAEDAPVYSFSQVYDILKRGRNFGYMDEAIEAEIKAGYLKNATVEVNTVDWNNGESRVNDLENGVAKNNWTSMIYADADLLAKEQYKVGYTWRTNSLHFKSVTVIKDFVYTKTIKTWYGQTITLFQPIKLTNPAAAYNYKPSGIHVSMDGNIPYSYANGVYTDANGKIIEKGAVAAFRVDAVDMDKAFSVVEGENQEIVADLAKVGLVSVFTLENNTDENIKIENNKINYQGDAEYVDVIGKLYIENSADKTTGIVSRFEIENTLFASEPYASYQVRKWDPIDSFTRLYEQPYTLSIVESKKYSYNLLKFFSLKDKFAGSEMINPDTAVESAWVVGNGENGFAEGKKAKGIYGLTESFEYTVDTDDNTILNAIDVKDGKLTINNEGQLIVLNPVTITVTATIDYPQGSKTETMQFVIPSRDPSKK